MITLEPTTDHARVGAARAVRPAAGITYLLAWIIGLLVFSSSTDVSATGDATLRSLRGHVPAAITQYLLTEVVAGLALAVVVVALARRRSVARVSGLIAAAVSVAQGAAGTWMCLAAVDDGRTSTVAHTTRALNAADGLKMLLLAVLIGSLLATARLPRWWRAVGAVTIPALVVSAIGYLLAAPAFAAAAWFSLPLLLITVVGAALARRGTSQPSAVGASRARSISTGNGSTSRAVSPAPHEPIDS